MEDGSVNSGDAFFRQRRNLIVASLALLLAQVYGLKVTTINLFGTIIVPNSEVNISHLLWIPFFYFAWRYSAYYRAVGATRQIQATMFNHLGTSLRKRADTRLRAILSNNARSLFTDTLWAYVKHPLKVFGSVNIKKNEMWEWQFTICVESQHETSAVETNPITFSVADLFIPNSFTFLRIAARERVFSDFIFPSLVAALPIMMLYGSLVRLLTM